MMMVTIYNTLPQRYGRVDGGDSDTTLYHRGMAELMVVTVIQHSTTEVWQS